jgi:hypothetical protein
VSVGSQWCRILEAIHTGLHLLYWVATPFREPGVEHLELAYSHPDRKRELTRFEICAAELEKGTHSV